MLSTDAQLARGRLLGDVLGNLRVAHNRAVLKLPNLGDVLGAEGTRLVLDHLAGLQVRVHLNDGLERQLLGVLIGQLGLGRRGADLNNLLRRLADGLGRVISGDLAVVGSHRHGVLDLARLALLDHLSLAGLELRVLTNLNLERRALGPLHSLGGGLTLGADLDDLLDRFLDALGFGRGTRDLRVLDGLGRGDLILARLAFLDGLLCSSRQGVIELNLGLERNPYLGLGGVRALSLGAYANDRVGRLLGALSGHGRLARRLAIHNLLSGGLHLSTVHALLVDDLLARLQRIIKDDFGLERHRLLGLGHHGGVLGPRAVLDDALDRLGAILGLGHLGLTVSSGEGSSVRRFAVLAFLDHLGLARCKVRVRAQGGAERNRLSPLHRVGRRGLLGAHGDDLINWFLGDFLGHGRLTVRGGVGDVALDGHRLLARHALGGHLGLACRHGRVVLNDDLVRCFRLKGLGVLTGGLSTHSDLSSDRLLSALGADLGVALWLAVDDLLRGGLDVGAEFALLVNNLLARLQGVVERHLRLERHRLLGLGHHGGVLGLRAILDDLLNWGLGLLALGYRGLVARRGELCGVLTLAVDTLLDHLGLARSQVRVRAGHRAIRGRRSPGDVLSGFGRLGADLHDLVGRCGGLHPRTVTLLLLFAGLALGDDLVGACGDCRVIDVLNVERHLARRHILDGDGCGDLVLRSIVVRHGDRNVNGIARLGLVRGRGHDVAVCIKTDNPIAVIGRVVVRRVAELVVLARRLHVVRGLDAVWLRARLRIVLSDLDAIRQLQVQRRRCGLTRENGLRRVCGLGFVVLRQVDHGAHGD